MVFRLKWPVEFLSNVPYTAFGWAPAAPLCGSLVQTAVGLISTNMWQFSQEPAIINQVPPLPRHICGFP